MLNKYSNFGQRSAKFCQFSLKALLAIFCVAYIANTTESAQAKGNSDKNTTSDSPVFIKDNPDPGCSTSRLTLSIACSGIYSGNDSNANLSGLFGINDWKEYTKINEPSQSNTLLNLTGNGTRSGTWKLNSPLSEYSSFMVILKAASTFTAYQVEGITSQGDWTTDDLRTNKGGIPELSHFSVYISELLRRSPQDSTTTTTLPGTGTPSPGTGTQPVGTAVPEPLTLFGAATASGLGILFKRRLAKAQKLD